MSRYERVQAHDGGSFDAFCARPDRERAPGVLLFQEIFHAFSNRDAPSMYTADAAELAWGRTLDFFGTHLRR
ncbi:dienelactone hydrolase family protein [Pseudonocardia oceani]|uniref:dienelactone hydrolase family protein n=1 Tax=Pseudonocardia oceani TaxID=2792013 RepID=UPI001CEC1C4F|nr:dienelactone hydrolase family protein [Pseudonocardia oceani]